MKKEQKLMNKQTMSPECLKTDEKTDKKINQETESGRNWLVWIGVLSVLLLPTIISFSVNAWALGIISAVLLNLVWIFFGFVLIEENYNKSAGITLLAVIFCTGIILGLIYYWFLKQQSTKQPMYSKDPVIKKVEETIVEKEVKTHDYAKKAEHQTPLEERIKLQAERIKLLEERIKLQAERIKLLEERIKLQAERIELKAQSEKMVDKKETKTNE